MENRICPFCDGDMALVGDTFHCVECDHSEPRDYDPPDPPGWEGGFADNH